jgi:hypothetical protein
MYNMLQSKFEKSRMFCKTNSIKRQIVHLKIAYFKEHAVFLSSKLKIIMYIYHIMIMHTRKKIDYKD